MAASHEAAAAADDVAGAPPARDAASCQASAFVSARVSLHAAPAAPPRRVRITAPAHHEGRAMCCGGASAEPEIPVVRGGLVASDEAWAAARLMGLRHQNVV